MYRYSLISSKVIMSKCGIDMSKLCFIMSNCSVIMSKNRVDLYKRCHIIRKRSVIMSKCGVVLSKLYINLIMFNRNVMFSKYRLNLPKYRTSYL